jgi:hypothetical protein
MELLNLPLSERAKETIQRLNDYRKNNESFEHLLENENLPDYIFEIADSRVSVYSQDRLQWLLENFAIADQYEAINSGASYAEDIAAYCWLKVEQENIEEDIEEIKEALKKLDQK